MYAGGRNEFIRGAYSELGPSGLPTVGTASTYLGIYTDKIETLLGRQIKLFPVGHHSPGTFSCAGTETERQQYWPRWPARPGPDVTRAWPRARRCHEAQTQMLALLCCSAGLFLDLEDLGHVY